MYGNMIKFKESIAKEVLSSQGGRIEQAFWIAWGNMANGHSYEKSFKNALKSSGLEPASKELLTLRLKKALGTNPNPKISDLPLAYRPKSLKTAMISDEWGEAAKKAKDRWIDCRKQNLPIGTKDLQTWLESEGYKEDLAKNVSNTISQYYRSVESHGSSISKEFSKSKSGLIKSAKEEYDFTCTMAFIPKDLAEKMVKVSLEIGDSSLYDPKDKSHKYGREIEPHITVKFGTHTSDPEEIKNALKDFPPAKVTLGRISFFDTNKDYDVVKIDVVSEDLEKANKAISDKCKCTDSHPDYKPHITIAYVEKGSCEYLKGKKDFDGIEIVFEELSFQDKVGNRTIIPLKTEINKEKASKKASVSVHPLDEKLEKSWFGIHLDANNYHQMVRSELIGVFQDIWKVSEKDFSKVDEIVKEADSVCRTQNAEKVILNSKSNGERPRLCAERIYCILKDEIRKPNESPN